MKQVEDLADGLFYTGQERLIQPDERNDNGWGMVNVEKRLRLDDEDRTGEWWSGCL